MQNVALPNKMVFAGEIGLSGEIRGINRIDQRLKEAEKLGFTDFIMSDQLEIAQKGFKIKIHKVGNVRQMFSLLFE
jgi:DNA repair protein RadA/Sms